MLKRDLVAELASHFPKIPKKDLQLLVNAFFSGLTEGIKSGRVEIRGFGVFTSYLKRPREIRHPISKKILKTTTRRTVHFRPTFKL